MGFFATGQRLQPGALLLGSSAQLRSEVQPALLLTDGSLCLSAERSTLTSGQSEMAEAPRSALFVEEAEEVLMRVSSPHSDSSHSAEHSGSAVSKNF